MTSLCRLLCALICAIALAAEDASSTTPAGGDPKRIYIANDDHTDFMWTADADTYGRAFVDLLDFHLDLADKTASNPPPYRDRFNADGSYWLWNYEQRKSPEAFARLIARVKDGTLSVPLNTVVSCYGGQPVEAVLRGMYYAGRLERRFGFRIPLAVAMENQTLPLGLPSLFAGAGAHYSWRGVCGCATRLAKAQLQNRPQEIYWWTGLDGQRLLLKWYSQNGPGIGGYWEAGSPVPAIEFVDGDAGFQRRYRDPLSGAPYRVIGVFGFGGDDLARKTGVPPPPTIPAVPGLSKIVSSPYCDHFHVIAQQQSNAQRQVIVSNESDFFADFEHRYGATLASVTATYGNEWDLYSASMSETAARAKRAVERLRTAELVAALVSLKHPSFLRAHSASRDRAFNGLGLFWEHNWTADGPISRPQRAAWENLVECDIDYYVDSVLGEGLIRLAGMVQRPGRSNRFLVLNPLGWPRSEAADLLYTGSADIHVRDVVSNRDVPHQIMNVTGARYLRILASDVPSAGYKVFEIMPGPGSAPQDDAATASADGGTLDNAALHLTIERDGALRSLIDRTSGYEFAGSIGDLRLNDQAKGSDDGEALRLENRGPVSVTICARSEAGLPHSTAITLFRGSSRVDIRNEITANFSDVRYWSFSTTLAKPQVHAEEVGAIILDRRRADGGDYADSHARYDHITVNHFADISDGAGSRGLTISNPDLAFAKMGNSTVTELDSTTPQLNFLAGGQIDGRHLGIPDQNGETHFLQRFSLHPHAAYDPVEAMRFALEHQNPLIATALIGGNDGPYPGTSYSLVSVNDPRTMLWAVKVADDGIERGIVARLWNISGVPVATTMTLATGITDAHRSTHIETDLEPVTPAADGSVPLQFAPQQLQTYRLSPTSGP